MKERQSTRCRPSFCSGWLVIAVTLVALAATGKLAAQPWEGQSTLGVQIRGKSGPVVGAVVEIRQRRPGIEIGPETLRTDSRGQANFVRISIGRWSLEIKHPDYLSFVATVNVKRGKKPEIVTQFLEASGPGRGTFRVKFLSSDQSLGETMPGTAADEARPRPAPVQQRLPRAVPVEPLAPKAKPVPESGTPDQLDPPAAPEVDTVSTPPVAKVPPPLDSSPKPIEKPAEVPIKESVEAMPGIVPRSDTPTEPSVVVPAPTSMVDDDVFKPDLEPEIPVTSPESPPELEAPVETSAEESVAESPVKPTAEQDMTPAVAAQVTPTAEPVEAPAVEPPAPSPPPISIEAATPELPELPQLPELQEAAELPEPAEPDQQPTAVPVVAKPPVAAPLPAPASAPDALRSYRDRTCFECKPGEWAVSSQLEIPSGEACRSTAEVAVRRALRDVAAAASDQLGNFGGPLLLDFGALPWTTVSSAARNTLAPYLEASASCRFLAVVVPRGARFTGFRSEARDANASGDCSGEEECDIGQAKFVFNPATARASGATIVYSLFENTGDRPRTARMTGFFLPAGGWSPE